MAAGDLITEDYQYEYKGLLLGAYTPFELQQMSGLTSLPNVRTGSVDRFGQHGGVPGRHYEAIRTVAATWDIFDGNDPEAFAARREELQEAFAVISDPTNVQPFVWKHPGREKRRIYCRPVDRTTPLDREFSFLYGSVAVRLEATDPFVYSNDEKVASGITPGETTGGLSFPLTFPLVFGAGSSGGSASVHNGGTADAPWTATITGETPNPKITHVESGAFLEFTGLNIVAGDTLEIDAFNRTILYNGVASRRGFLTSASNWFWLQPGSNTIQFSSGGITTGSLTFRWRDTYWSD
jgi:hypothetical protein